MQKGGEKMKKIVFLTRREYVAKHEPNKVSDVLFLGGVVGCPRHYGLDNEKCEEYTDETVCKSCWNRFATKNGKYIAKVVSE